MDFIISLILFFLAVIIHEVAHGLMAYKLGDPTAKYAGRLTLNPLAHIDPFGTIILPIFLIFTNSPFVFGWAKPVPVNFAGLRNPKRDIALVGLAGPLANIVLAVIISILLKFYPFGILQDFMVLNLVLAVFNLIPIPPLDGSRVLIGFLPQRLAYKYILIEKFGIFIIFVMIYFGLFKLIVLPVVMAILKFLL